MNTTWKKISFGLIAVTIMAIGTVSVVNQKTTPVDADTPVNLTSEGNESTLIGPPISKFQLMPKALREGTTIIEGLELSSFPTSIPFFGTNYNLIFRQFGSSLMDKVYAYGNASFDNLFVGFGAPQNPPTEAKLQVDGIIKIESLADSTKTAAEPVCVNDFGKFERCSTIVTVPTVVNGQCQSFPSAYTSQPADSTNGCLAGTYADTSDTSSLWQWECQGFNGGTTDSCSANIDVVTAPSCLAPTLTSLVGPNQVNFDINGETNATASVVYSSTNGTTWSGGSTAGYNSPRTVTLTDGNYYKMKTICSGSDYSDDSNVLQYTATTGGACEGSYTYTTTGTSTKVDWNGDPLNWQSEILYNDAGEAVYNCSANIIPQNVDVWHTTSAPYTDDNNGTWGDGNGTDNYYCEYIGNGSLLNTNGTYSCTVQGNGDWIISGGGPNNNSLNSQSQDIKNQLCNYGYTTAYRFWSPADSGNWAQYITAAGTSFYPGYTVTKNGYQGALTAYTGGGTTTYNCSQSTSYGQSYCETYPTNDTTCTWNPAG